MLGADTSPFAFAFEPAEIVAGSTTAGSLAGSLGAHAPVGNDIELRMFRSSALLSSIPSANWKLDGLKAVSNCLMGWSTKPPLACDTSELATAGGAALGPSVATRFAVGSPGVASGFAVALSRLELSNDAARLADGEPKRPAAWGEGPE